MYKDFSKVQYSSTLIKKCTDFNPSYPVISTKRIAASTIYRGMHLFITELTNGQSWLEWPSKKTELKMAVTEVKSHIEVKGARWWVINCDGFCSSVFCCFFAGPSLGVITRTFCWTPPITDSTWSSWALMGWPISWFMRSGWVWASFKNYN